MRKLRVTDIKWLAGFQEQRCSLHSGLVSTKLLFKSINSKRRAGYQVNDHNAQDHQETEMVVLTTRRIISHVAVENLRNY